MTMMTTSLTTTRERRTGVDKTQSSVFENTGLRRRRRRRKRKRKIPVTKLTVRKCRV